MPAQRPHQRRTGCPAPLACRGLPAGAGGWPCMRHGVGGPRWHAVGARWPAHGVDHTESMCCGGILFFEKGQGGWQPMAALGSQVAVL